MAQSIQEWNIREIQPVKIWRGMFCLADNTLSHFVNAVFLKFYLVHSWIICPKYTMEFTLLNSPLNEWHDLYHQFYILVIFTAQIG